MCNAYSVNISEVWVTMPRIYNYIERNIRNFGNNNSGCKDDLSDCVRISWINILPKNMILVN